MPTTWDAVGEVDPEILVLMPCGFDLQRTVEEWERLPRPVGWDTLRAVEAGPCSRPDGSAYFSRPGPRVIDGIELLAELIDPAAFDGMSPNGSWERVSYSSPAARRCRSATGSTACGAARRTWSRRRTTLEGWAQLCPACLGKAGTNPFLRTRLRTALAERGRTGAATVARDACSRRAATTRPPPAPRHEHVPLRPPSARLPVPSPTTGSSVAARSSAVRSTTRPGRRSSTW